MGSAPQPKGYAEILFALPEEAQALAKRWPKNYVGGSPYWWVEFWPLPATSWYWVGAICSGTGSENAVKCANVLFDRLKKNAVPVDFALICGFAGGLAAGLEPGSIVVADCVLNNVTGESFMTDSTLLRAAESVRVSGIKVQRGTLATADRVLVTQEEKRELAAKTDAIAVDMESAGAARIATTRKIPWLAIRVVTDGLEDEMPLDFNALADAEGNVDRKRVVAATLTHPWKIPALIRLGARSSKAANNLARFLEAFLQALPESAGAVQESGE